MVYHMHTNAVTGSGPQVRRIDGNFLIGTVEKLGPPRPSQVRMKPNPKRMKRKIDSEWTAAAQVGRDLEPDP